MEKKVIVAYLSRYQDKESEQLFRQFAESYLTHPAGYPHELVIAKKGYQNHQDAWEKRIVLLKDVPFNGQEVSDFFYEPWREILDRYSDYYVLCLNAHAKILVDNWLDMYMRHAAPNRILSATGNNCTNHLQWEQEYNCGHTKTNLLKQPRKWFFTKLRKLIMTFYSQNQPTYLENPFPPQPVPTIRSSTNLFPPNTPNDIKWSPPETLGVKMCAYLYETGKYGLNGQIVANKFEAFVVGSDGRATPISEAKTAETYYCEGQKNLIISDNNTRIYDNCNAQKKRSCERYVWGTPPLGAYQSFDLEAYKNEKLIPCPVCGHRRTFPYIISQDYNQHVSTELFYYNKCEACFSLFLTNPPENTGDYYPNNYGPHTKNIEKPFINWQTQLIQKYVPQGSKYFEIGPGIGDLLKAVKKAGYQVNGVEMSKDACDYLKNEGIEIINSSDILETIKNLSENYDCIVGMHVLEHLTNPIQILRAAKDKLKAGGIMIIGMPHPSSFEAELFREYYHHLDAPRHQTLMTHETFVEIAKNLGLDEIETSWDDPHAQLIDRAAMYESLKIYRNNVVQKQSGFKNYTRYKMMKIFFQMSHKLLETFAGKRKLGNSYTVVFRKNGCF